MTNCTRSTLHRVAASLGVAAVGLAAASCINLGEHPISGITSAYYTSPTGYQAAVNASYEELRNWYGQERGLTMTVFGTDEFTKGADGSFKHYNDYTAALNGDDSFVRDAWRGFFRGINIANTVIADTTAQVSAATRTEGTAEARFLRAMYYFDLVRTYGAVPLNLTPTLAPTTVAHRDSVSAVYDAIIADLQYASANLPSVQKDWGRATKPAAQHMLALVYLTRGNPGDMPLAEAEADSVINSGLFHLLPNWADLWKLGNEKNPEIIWSVQYTADPLTTGPGNTSHLYFIMAYELWPGMHRDLANGRAFKRFRSTDWLLNLWDRTTDVRYDDGYTTVYYANQTASKCPNGGISIAVGDTAIWMPGFEMSTAEQLTHHVCSIITPSHYTDAAFPSFNQKFIDPNRLTVNDTRGSRDWYVARLAETYLIAAEAYIRDGRPDLALPYVNLVRERAAKPGVPATAMDVPIDSMSVDFILNERSRELAGEQMRWFDLVRTGTFLDRLQKYNPAAWAGVSASGSPTHFELRPIPNEQITLTSNAFPQNPGY